MCALSNPQIKASPYVSLWHMADTALRPTGVRFQFRGPFAKTTVGDFRYWPILLQKSVAGFCEQ
jgi:hypothetical protein